MSTENICLQPENALPSDRLQTGASDAERQEDCLRETAQEAAGRERLSRGDSEIIALLYDHYAAPLYRVLTAILGRTADAEDALQEVFVKLAQGKHRRIRNLRAYLFTAARNEACTVLRRRGRERAWEAADSLLQTVDNTASGEMQSLLHRLPVEQREVIAMKIYEEMTFAEIAVIVKAAPNTVASRYRYGIERLREWVQEENTHENQA